MIVYLNRLIDKIYAILPLSEGNQTIHLPEYLDSLWLELCGARQTFSCLADDTNYISLLNIIGYLSTHMVEHRRIRREVFKAISLTQKVIVSHGGDAGE